MGGDLINILSEKHNRKLNNMVLSFSSVQRIVFSNKPTHTHTKKTDWSLHEAWTSSNPESQTLSEEWYGHMENKLQSFLLAAQSDSILHVAMQLSQS